MRFTRKLTLVTLAIIFGVFAWVRLPMRVAAQTVGSWSCSLASAPWQQGATSWTNWTCSKTGQATEFYEIAMPASPASTWFQDEAAILVSELTSQGSLVTPTPGTAITPTPAPVVTAPVAPSATITQFQTDYLLLRECQAADSHLGSITDTFCAAQLTKVQGEYAANESTLLPYIQVGP